MNIGATIAISWTVFHSSIRAARFLVIKRITLLRPGINLKCWCRSYRLGHRCCSLLFFVYAALVTFHQSKSFSACGIGNISILFAFYILSIKFILVVSTQWFSLLVTILFQRFRIYIWAVIVVIRGWWVCATRNPGTIWFCFCCGTGLACWGLGGATWVMSCILWISMFWTHWRILINPGMVCSATYFKGSLLTITRVGAHNVTQAIFVLSSCSLVRILHWRWSIWLITCAINTCIVGCFSSLFRPPILCFLILGPHSLLNS